MPTTKLFGRFNCAQHAAQPKNPKNSPEPTPYKNFTIDNRNNFERNANRFLKTYFIMEENPKSEILTRINNLLHKTSTALTQKKLMINWVRKIVTLPDFTRPNPLLQDTRYLRALRSTSLHSSPSAPNITLQKFTKFFNRKYNDPSLSPPNHESQKPDTLPITKFVLQYLEVLQVYPKVMQSFTSLCIFITENLSCFVSYRDLCGNSIGNILDRDFVCGEV